MSALLVSSTLEPHGRDGLCAIRFSSAVRVHKLRIHRSEPEAVVLDVYLNCQPVPTAAEPKPRATNALVPSRIVHAGGARDFAVNMSLEYSTKLMVIKGDFVSADVSVYGTLCTPGIINTSPALQPRASTIVTTKQHLPPSLDPAYASGDPLQLGRALLAMMADPPALPLVVKFALCHDLHEELGAHSGVQLYTDLTNCMDSLDIGLDWVRTAVETTKRPVTEQVADDTLKQFAERVQDSLYDKHEDQAGVLSDLLKNTACQSHSVARVFISMWDPELWGGLLMAGKDNVDTIRPILRNLLHAAASKDVTDFLRRGIWDTVDALAYDVDYLDYGVRRLARQLRSRIKGWESLRTLTASPKTNGDSTPQQAKSEDDNSMDTDAEDSDATFLTPWIHTMLSSEATLGTFLLSIVSTPSLLDSLTSAPDIEIPPCALAQDLGQWQSVRHLFRAVIGVGGVLAALAWSDASDDPPASARILGVLRLWQARTQDYGALLGTTLVVSRIFNMVDAQIFFPSDDPSTSASQSVAETIVRGVMHDPRSAGARHVWGRFLDADLDNPASILNSVASPASELERLEALAKVVGGGLTEALRHLDAHSKTETGGEAAEQITRFALEIVRQNLAELGGVGLRAASWDSEAHTVEYVLSDVLAAHANTLAELGATAGVGRATQLFANAAVALGIVDTLLGSTPEPLPTAITRGLVQSIVALVGSARTWQHRSDLVAFTSEALINAAFGVVEAFSDSSAKVALCALANAITTKTNVDLPATMDAVADILDTLIPRDAAAEDEDSTKWIAQVALPALTELHTIVGSLAPKRKAQVILQLVALDKDDTGVADWIVQQELTQLERCALALVGADGDIDSPAQVLLRARISQAFEWIAAVAQEQIASPANGDSNGNGNSAHLHAPKIAWAEPSLARTLIALIDADYIALDSDGPLMRAARTLRPCHDQLLCFALAVVLVGDTQDGSLRRVVELLQSLATQGEDPDGLRLEMEWDLDPPQLAKFSLRVGRALSRMAETADESVAVDPALADIVAWLVDRHDDFESFVLHGVSDADFASVIARVEDDTAKTRLGELREQLRCAAASAPTVPTVSLASRVQLTAKELAAALAKPSAGSQPVTIGGALPGTPPPRQASALLELATVSPPTSLLRSPRVAFTGLTKTYLKNDFRQLRTLPSGRINTSRLPSQHVDDFENASPGSQQSPTPTHLSPVHQHMAAAMPIAPSLPLNPGLLHLPTGPRF